jgi:hypothetical protein
LYTPHYTHTCTHRTLSLTNQHTQTPHTRTHLPQLLARDLHPRVARAGIDVFRKMCLTKKNIKKSVCIGHSSVKGKQKIENFHSFIDSFMNSLTYLCMHKYVPGGSARKNGGYIPNCCTPTCCLLLPGVCVCVCARARARARVYIHGEREI